MGRSKPDEVRSGAAACAVNPEEEDVDFGTTRLSTLAAVAAGCGAGVGVEATVAGRSNPLEVRVGAEATTGLGAGTETVEGFGADAAAGDEFEVVADFETVGEGFGADEAALDDVEVVEGFGAETTGFGAGVDDRLAEGAGVEGRGEDGRGADGFGADGFGELLRL